MTDPFATPPPNLTPDELDRTVGLLVLRHLHDGDVIEYPVPDAHPHRAIFAALERQALIARWDRTWPLHDRYRLTEMGIAQIETLYKPADATRIYEEMLRQNLAPDQRREYLKSLGYDPFVWAVVHDPHTHWSTWRDDPGPYYGYVYETWDSGPVWHRDRSTPHDHGPTRIVDLDQEAGRAAGGAGDAKPLGDVS